jgi:hypothetical protein
MTDRGITTSATRIETGGYRVAGSPVFVFADLDYLWSS